MTKTNIAFKRQSIGSETKHIVLIGAGNVTTHLSRHLYAQGHAIDCIWSRSMASARKLAAQVKSEASSEPAMVPREADFYIVAVPDRAVAAVAAEFQDCRGIWLHTSGALSMDVFKDLFPAYGVLYPLQTLSKEIPLHSGIIPFLVEGSTGEVSARIHGLASSISDRVQTADSESRLIVHLAAVFANNFSNHLVSIAQQILEEQNLSLDLLDPLLVETFHKMTGGRAREAQTGPAVRNDQITMNRHIEWLKKYPEWEKLYTFMSREIARHREEQA